MKQLADKIADALFKTATSEADHLRKYFEADVEDVYAGRLNKSQAIGVIESVLTAENPHPFAEGCPTCGCLPGEDHDTERECGKDDGDSTPQLCPTCLLRHPVRRPCKSGKIIDGEGV